MIILSFKICVSLLMFCLVDLSIVVSGVLKSPTIIVLLLICPFMLVNICLSYCGAPMLGAYIFIIVISSSWINHLPLCSVLLCLFHGLYFKVYLIWFEYLYSCFLLVSCWWNIFFEPFTFSLYLSLGLRWVSCRRHI